MTRPSLSLAVLLLVLAVPAGAAPEDETLREEVERGTRETLDELFSAFRALDADRCYDVYATGPEVLHISDLSSHRVDSLKPRTAALFETLRSLEGSWIPHTLQVVTPDVAIRTVRLELAFVSEDGESTDLQGLWTLVLRRSPDGWKIVHRSSDRSPAGDG